MFSSPNKMFTIPVPVICPNVFTSLRYFTTFVQNFALKLVYKTKLNKQLFADRSLQVAYTLYDLPNIYFVFLSLWYFPKTCSNFSFLHLAGNTVHHVIYWYHNVSSLFMCWCVRPTLHNFTYLCFNRSGNISMAFNEILIEQVKQHPCLCNVGLS